MVRPFEGNPLLGNVEEQCVCNDCVHSILQQLCGPTVHYFICTPGCGDFQRGHEMPSDKLMYKSGPKNEFTFHYRFDRGMLGRHPNISASMFNAAFSPAGYVLPTILFRLA